MNSRRVAIGLVAVLLCSAVGGLFVGGVGASGTATVTPSDSSAGATTTYEVSIPVDDSSAKESGGSLTGLKIDFNDSSTGAAFDLTGITNQSIVALGIGSSSGNITTSAHYDVSGVSVKDDGTMLDINAGGNEDISGGDYVTIRFTGVTNPSHEGEYGVVTDLNPQSVTSPETGSVQIEDTTPPSVDITLTNPSGATLEAVVSSDDRLSGLNVSIGDAGDRSLDLSAFNESGGAGDWTYSTTLTGDTDGDYTATVEEAVDGGGNTVTPEDTDSASVNTKTIRVDGGNVTPAEADAGATVSQTVDVSVSQASLDGESERITFTVDDSVGIENATASISAGSGSASVQSTSIDANNTSVTARVASGDGGGTAAYTVSYDVDATYTGEGPRNETVDASAVDSDDGDSDGPDRIASVHVNDVTPPRITNFTLIEGPGGAQDVDLELNASEELASATVDLTGDAGGSLSLGDATNRSNGDGTWSYTFDVNDGMDGEFAADIDEGAATDLGGNTNPDSHNDSLRVNEEAIEVVDANVTNALVDRGETVTHTVTVDVDDVSKDGNDDTVQVVFPEAVGAENVTLNDVGTNATGSSTTTADGGAAFNVTVNPGDGGGVADVNVSFDVTADYPESLPEGESYPVNASAFDSDGDSDGPDNHTQVAVRSVPPTITNFTLFTQPADSRDIDLRFNASERLGSATVTFENDLTHEVGSLTLSGDAIAGSENADGSWSYTADVHEGDDGQFDASLSAADQYGIAATGDDLDASLTVNETDPLVVDATVDPASVRPNGTVTGNLSVDVDGFSRDGSTDEILLEFGSGVTVENPRNFGVESRNGGSPGTNGLGTVDDRTVRLNVSSGDGLGTENLTATFDAEVDYGAALEGESVPLNVTAIDSDGATNATTNETHVDVVDTNPVISNFTLNETADGVDLGFDSTEALAEVTVNVTGDLDGGLTLDRDDFTQSYADGNWTYTNESLLTADGTYDASLDAGAALDSDDNANPDSHSDEVFVDNYAIDVVAANVTAEPVDPNSTVSQQVTVDVQNVSRDGVDDTVAVEFPDSAGIDATNVTSTVGSASLVDGTENLTATVTTGGDGGVADLTLTYEIDATYPLSTEDTTLAVNASAEDSDGASDHEGNLTSVRVRNTVPEITNFTLFQSPSGSQDVALRFNATEKLETAEVSFEEDLAGETRTLSGNVSLVDLVDGTYVYGAGVDEGADGEFNASLTATDPAGNDAEGDLDASLTVNETDPVVVDATIEPNATDPATTVAENLTVTVDGFSRDGATDRVEITLPDGVTVESTSGLELTGAGDGGSLTHANETITIDVDSGDGLGTANVTAAFDAEISYGNGLEGESVPLNVTATDSDGATNATANVTHVRVRDTVPLVTNFTLDNTADGVDLSFDSTEELETVTVDVTGDLDATRTLDRGNFTENASDGNYTYTAGNVVTTDGTYNATLAVGGAADGDDNANQERHESSATRNRNGIDVVAANVSDEPVDPQSTVDQQVTVDVANVTLDGETDTVDVTFADPVDVTAVNVSSTVGSATLSDAGNLTAEVETGSGGGVTDLTLTYNVTATYGDALEGESLAVDASATDSDGDEDDETALTNVSVRDTVPTISNFTLTNESRNVDLGFDSTEALETITVETTGDSAGAELTREAFTETETSDGFRYEANVSDGVDGVFNASLAPGAAVDNADNANENAHTANLTVDTRDVVLVSATVTPDSVDPEATVETNLTVSADDFGRDGGTDTLTLALNESLNVTAVTGETVTAGDATATGAEALDTDGDGTAERVEISLATGDGGGTVDVTAAVNATITYPAGVEGATLGVDAEATDSDGSSDAETAMANVTVREEPPTVANFTLNATGQDVDVSFTASERLSTTVVDLGGNLNDTLTGLNGTQVAGDEWRYTGNVSDDRDGYFTATLSSAVDRFGNDGAGGEFDSVRVDTVAPKIQQNRISPDALLPGERTNQTLTTNVTGLSLDGVNDTVVYEFANESTVALENVTAEGANASAVVTDNATAVVVNVSTANATGNANVTLSTNVTATYANSTEGEAFNVTALVNDSLNETAGPVNTTVVVNDTVPTITAFNLTAEGQAVNLTVAANESLAFLNATLGGDLNDTLTRGNFTENASGGNYSYTANVSEGFDGNFSATLTNATDPFGNNATVGQNDSLVVDTENVTLGDVNVTPSEVRPNATVQQTTVLNASDLGLDGVNDTATVAFGNATDVLAANASVDGDNATVAVANVTDADLDGVNETVDLAINTTDDLGTANISVVLNTTAYYNGSLEGENVTVDAVLNDSGGSNASLTHNVTVVDTVPNVTAFDLNATAQDVDLVVRTNESLASLNASLAGDLNDTLTRGNFTETYDNGTHVYTANVSEGYDGNFSATLTDATDPFGNNATVGQNDSLTVDTENVTLDGVNVTPETVRPNATVQQTTVLNASDLGLDGINDTATVTFDNATDVLAANASVDGDNATVAVANITDADLDGVNGTVEVSVNTTDALGTANLSVVLNTTAYYNGSLEGKNVTVDAVLNDSGGSNASLTRNVTVVDTVPNVTAFDLNATAQDVNLTVAANESLGTLNASLGDDLDDTLTRGNFTETYDNGTYVYTANVSEGYDGNFSATLTDATDPAGNNATVGQSDSLTVDTENVSLGGVTVTPGAVQPNATVTQSTVLNVSSLNADGVGDTATVVLGNGTDVLDATATVDDANATVAVANVSDANADGHNETVEVALNTTDALGTANLTLTVNATTAFDGSLEGTNVSVDAVLNDSDGSNDATGTNVSVVDTVPTIAGFDVGLNGSTVRLTMRADEPLDRVRVALSGATGGNLTRADFETSRDGEWTVYTATLAERRGGRFGAELIEAADAAGNDGAGNENASLTIRVSGGGGGGGGQQGGESGENITRISDGASGPALSVVVRSVDDGRQVVVENARPGAEVAAHLTPTGAETNASVRLSDIGFATTTEGTATMTVHSDRSTAAFDSLPDDVDPVMAYEVIPEGVGETDYTIRVADSRLGERSAESLRVFDAQGNELNASYQGETADQHGFRVDTDAERFAVALSGANVTVADASLPAANGNGTANVSTDTVFVNVTVRNTGPVAGNRTVTVTAANEPVAERTVRVGANTTRTVQLIADLSDLNREGPTLIEANEVEAGTIPPADQRPDPDSTSTTADSPFALATLLVALAGAALLARRE